MLGHFATMFVAALILLPMGPVFSALPVNPYFSDDFNYAYGSPLNNAANWDGGATTEIAIDASAYDIKMTGGTGSKDAYHILSYPGANGIIWVHFVAKAGGTGSGATMWSLWLDDPSGNNLARYYGGASSCRGRIGGTGTVTNLYDMPLGQWNDLDVEINTTANTCSFYLNSTFLGTLDHGTTPSNTLGRIRWERLDYSAANGHTILFDSLQVGEKAGAQTQPPAAPTVTAPTSGFSTDAQSVTVQWTGDPHDQYEVHVNTADSAEPATGWDSGQVSSSGTSCVTGNLSSATYYVFARLHNPGGWGPWSQGVQFSVIVPPVRIIPAPQQITWKSGAGFLVNGSTQIMANSSPDAREQNTATQLQRKVWDMTGYKPTIVYGGSNTSNVIAIGDPARCPAVSSIIATWPDASGKVSKSEGYMLGIRDTSIVIRGFDNAGTFYGCQTLIQFLEQCRTTAISPAFSYDFPDLPWRGTYFRIRVTHDWAFTKELMAEVLARFKMNRIFPDVYMPYISHPECPVAPNAVTQADYADFINFCKLHYMTDIEGPDVAVFGTDGSLHSDLRENQSLPIGQPNDLCFRNPNARALLNDLQDELIDLTGTQYMQTGMSEFRQLGWDGCPHCGAYSNEWLYADFLTKDRDDLYTGHGVTPIVWGDMLNPNQNGAPNLWNTANAVDSMPNETIIFDWLYGSPGNVPTDYPSLDIWCAHGKKACGSPYGFGNHPEYSQFYGDKENIYYWANAVNNRRATYPNLMLGIVAFNKYQANNKRVILDSALSMDFLEEFPFYGEWGWNTDGRYWNPYPYDGKVVLRNELSPDRALGFAASLAGGDVSLSWTNPSDSAFQGTWIVYRTDRTPTDPTDGVVVADVMGLPNAAASFTHTAAPLGATVYYAAFSHDSVRHFSPSAAATQNLGSPLSLSSVHSTANGKALCVAGAVVTAVFQSCFYIEDASRLNAIRVEGTAGVVEGDIVTVTGTMGVSGAERSMTALFVTVTGHRASPVAPFALRNSTIGGVNKGYSQGAGGVGPYNVGLLLRTSGIIENPDPGGAYFWVNDRSKADGVKVVLTDTKTPVSIPMGSYVQVTGVSSLGSDGTVIIRPRAQADILPRQ